MFVFKHRYPQSFIEFLEKILGVKFTKVKPSFMKSEDVPVCPLSAPSQHLFYLETSYKKP